MRRLLRLFLIGWVVWLSGVGAIAPAAAHEVRPAYLEIVERADGKADVLWKHPAMGEIAVALRPRIDRLIDRAPDLLEGANSFSLARWRGVDLGGKGLAGRKVRIEGLENTITDALLVVRPAKGDVVQTVLTPARPEYMIEAHDGAAVPAYLKLGVEHILTGVDHLLFVFGLILLSAGLGRLLKTITAFTVAHSITLALTALGWLHLPPSLVEAMVALSILFLGVELVRKQRGEDGLTIRYPWIIAFGFGLLHGAAFAGALQDIGLPEGNIPAALFMFNLGVEVGQLLFVTAVAAVLFALRRLPLPARAPRWGEAIATYAIGSFSAFWFFERLYAALTVA